ncbi:TetR/AcrR family transcriptional regulator [Clostridium sp.]|uniref:TetR/AcrR family transcriptional regulator n=1 Tax=Clostridium sp. TaxID=1506 RepID=UPI003F39FFED
MTKRSEQKEKRRIEIIYKGLDLFVQKGYAGTKTSEIAKELGISEGLFFHYFPTKESLYIELVKLGVQGTEIFEGDIDNPYEYLFQILKEFLERTKMNRRVAKMFILVDRAQNKETTPPAVYEVAKQVIIIEASVPIIEKGQSLGQFRDGDPLALSYAFWNAVQGNMEELARKDEMPVPEPDWLMAILKK